LPAPSTRRRRRGGLSVTLAFTTQFIKAARDGDVLTIFGAWRPSSSQSTFAAETEIYDQTRRPCRHRRRHLPLPQGRAQRRHAHFLDQKAAD
jgi:acyl-coenzyme A thioesterase PaaI-like protein